MPKCTDDGHSYAPTTAGHYVKWRDDTHRIQDESTVFRTIYCTRCGDVLELLVEDYRPYRGPTTPRIEAVGTDTSGQDVRQAVRLDRHVAAAGGDRDPTSPGSAQNLVRTVHSGHSHSSGLAANRIGFRSTDPESPRW